MPVIASLALFPCDLCSVFPLFRAWAVLAQLRVGILDAWLRQHGSPSTPDWSHVAAFGQLIACSLLFWPGGRSSWATRRLLASCILAALLFATQAVCRDRDVSAGRQVLTCRAQVVHRNRVLQLSCPADHRLCTKQSDRVHAGESCWGSQDIAAEQIEHRCRNQDYRAQVVYRKTGVQVFLTKAQGVHREQAQERLCRSCRTCHKLCSAVLAGLEFSRHMHRLLRRMQTCRFLPSKMQGVHRNVPPKTGCAQNTGTGCKRLVVVCCCEGHQDQSKHPSQLHPDGRVLASRACEWLHRYSGVPSSHTCETAQAWPI